MASMMTGLSVEVFGGCLKHNRPETLKRYSPGLSKRSWGGFSFKVNGFGSKELPFISNGLILSGSIERIWLRQYWSGRPQKLVGFESTCRTNFFPNGSVTSTPIEF